ncbi:hypothetical protein DPEC_G00012020 [Dallia pectoralis]|uniref:Uncharacterized protein n=1 Tax=Dallia pectoralis TaxID=75939 RepID=A0ACC2HLK0_DALPE|nr:hypothetical protein DPEC_G00012020 [Dallia pectoralis]
MAEQRTKTSICHDNGTVGIPCLVAVCLEKVKEVGTDVVRHMDPSAPLCPSLPTALTRLIRLNQMGVTSPPSLRCRTLHPRQACHQRLQRPSLLEGTMAPWRVEHCARPHRRGTRMLVYPQETNIMDVLI